MPSWTVAVPGSIRSCTRATFGTAHHILDSPKPIDAHREGHLLAQVKILAVIVSVMTPAKIASPNSSRQMKLHSGPATLSASLGTTASWRFGVSLSVAALPDIPTRRRTYLPRRVYANAIPSGVSWVHSDSASDIKQVRSDTLGTAPPN